MQKIQSCEIRSCDQMPKLYVQFFLSYKDSELFLDIFSPNNSERSQLMIDFLKSRKKQQLDPLYFAKTQHLNLKKAATPVDAKSISLRGKKIQFIFAKFNNQQQNYSTTTIFHLHFHSTFCLIT